MAELTLASNGMLYGTTSDSVNLGGTVFRLEADGSVTNLWDFGEDNPFDPAASYARLLQASDGLLYGTTSAGGAASEGTIFSLDLDGSVRRILHSFSLPGPRIPKGGVIEASDGHLYGTTSQGGAHDVGTVYRIDREGSNFTTLHVFSKHRDDGAEPLGELVETSPGVFVGTTALGGKANAGTVFQMLATGEFTVLYSFTGSLGAGEPSLDGAMPQATLTPVNGTTLFGVTARGGAEGIGTVFKLSAP
jgi:uncharacterized repeat protein (TIGR03803 family)